MGLSMMILTIWVCMVYSNGVGAKLLHQRGVQSTLHRVRKRVVPSGLIGNTWWPVSVVDTLVHARHIPLIYHCFPSLVKNFEPFAAMVGMALLVAVRVKAAKAVVSGKRIIDGFAK